MKKKLRVFKFGGASLAEIDRNSLNVVRVTAGAVEVTPHLRRVPDGEFEARETVVMPRRGTLDPGDVVTARPDGGGPR